MHRSPLPSINTLVYSPPTLYQPGPAVGLCDQCNTVEVTGMVLLKIGQSYKSMASAYFLGSRTVWKAVTQAGLWRHPQVKKLSPSNSQVSEWAILYMAPPALVKLFNRTQPWLSFMATPSQNRPAKLLLDSTQKLWVITQVCCFKLLNFGMMCYTVITKTQWEKFTHCVLNGISKIVITTLLTKILSIELILNVWYSGKLKKQFPTHSSTELLSRC